MSNEFLGEMNEFFDSAQQGTTPTSIIRQTTTNQNQVLEMFYNKLAEMGMNLDELRPILECEDNLLILSGAGAGKTTTLILKIIRDLLSGTMMTVNTVNTIHGVSHVHVPAKILVSTFLRTGAQELQASLREWCEKLGVTGVDYSSIQFKTIHSEVKEAITHMGAPVRILENTNDLIKSVALKYGIRSVSATTRSISADEVNELATIMAYARNRLDMKRYDHPLASDYGLNTLLMDAFLADFKMFRQATGQMDFEDMQELLLDALRTNPNVENFILARYDYVFVDEYQDTSQLQYELLKYYFKGSKRVIVVGDSEQCLIEGTMIQTDLGLKPIQDIQVGDRVLSGVGLGESGYYPVDKTSKRMVVEDISVIKLKSGRVLKGTKDHIAFAKIPDVVGKYYVYLMYRHDIGFRIGVTQTMRQDSRLDKHGNYKNVDRCGINMRLNFERGDKAWVLHTTDSLEDARDKEESISLNYGIPTYMFEYKETYKSWNYKLTQEEIIEMHERVDSKTKGMLLLDAMGYLFEYPHFRPKGKNDKLRLNLRLFSETATSKKTGVHKSSLSADTMDSNFSAILGNYMPISTKHTTTSEKLYTSASKAGYSLDDYFDVAFKVAREMEAMGYYIDVVRRARFTEQDAFDFMPLGNFIVGMLVPITLEDGSVVEDEVVSVETESYQGYVYDMSVPHTRNFSANGILVKNCIYSWRGSDNDIIKRRHIEDFNPTILNLTTNYRCKANILNAVKPSIMINGSPHSETLRAAKEGGEVSIIYDADVNHMVTSLKSDLMRKYSVGVLARTNADLLIPALILELDGNINFSLSKSVNLNGRMPRQIINMLDLVTKRVTNDFESLFKTFLKRYDWHEAEKLYNVLVANRSLSIYSIEEKDLEYSVPTLYHGFLKGLRQAYKKDQVTAYLYILELLEQKVFTGSSTYVQKARDLTYFIKKLIMEHEALKDLSLMQIDVLFRSTLPERLATRTKYNTNAIVKLTTVHEAKGKEWDSVYIWNNTEGAFPNQVGNRDLTEDEFQEERRVHYIAWTRAKDKLTVYTSKLKPGTFLKECDSSYYNQTNPEPESETKHLFKRDTGTPALDTLETARNLTLGYIAHLRQTGGITDDNVANMEIVVSNYDEKELIRIMHDEYAVGTTRETEQELRDLFSNIFSALADRIIMGGNYHV